MKSKAVNQETGIPEGTVEKRERSGTWVINEAESKTRKTCPRTIYFKCCE